MEQIKAFGNPPTRTGKVMNWASILEEAVGWLKAIHTELQLIRELQQAEMLARQNMTEASLRAGYRRMEEEARDALRRR